MSGVIISSGLVIADSLSGGGTVNADNPIIGYNNLVTAANVSATSAASGSPVSNLALKSTILRWQAAAASPAVDQYLTFDLQTNELVDYIAIARHNLFTAQCAISVEILDTSVSPQVWTEVVSPSIPSSDGPLLFRFTPQGIEQIRLRIQPGSTEPYIAVVYSGVLLVLQRRIYVDHTPINMNEQQSIANHRSISGDFLGRVILSERNATQIVMSNLTPAWYRTYMEPFRVFAKQSPFFFAWRPSSYPSEIGFVWTTQDPQPANELPNGMMQISFDVEGVT